MHLTVTARDNSIPPVTTTFSVAHIRNIDNNEAQQNGGATVIGVLDGSTISMHQTKCDSTDGFSRRLGTLMCLDRFVAHHLSRIKRWYIVAYRCDHQGYSLVVDNEERTDWSSLSEKDREMMRISQTRRQWVRITALASAHRPGKWVEYTTEPKEDAGDVVYTSKKKRRFQRT